MINAKIIDITVKDIRFPTSLWGIGSDSMHPNVDHSCIYVTIKTNNENYKGYGITCTVGRGNELVLLMCELLSKHIKNKTTTEIYTDFVSVWKMLTYDRQLRMLGPESGVVHVATAAITNALWDLWARIENKPVWKLLTDMTPEQLVSLIDFKYIENVLSKEEAIEMLREKEPGKIEFEQRLKEKGYPAYVADAGWIKYSHQKIRDLSKKFVKLDFNIFKATVESESEPVKSLARCRAMRKIIGWKKELIVDANQTWNSQESFQKNVNYFKLVRPFCIEDPLSPDDYLGYAFLASNYVKQERIKIATGKMCSNRVICKGFNRMRPFDIWHINVARFGGVNEALAVYFMLRKYNKELKIKNKLTWACANGVGLGEMMQHLQMWEFICLSQSTKDTIENINMIEFVNHQHGYFKNPIHIQNAHYMPPKFPGFSTELKEKCITRWSYPEGTRWKYLFETKHFKKEYGKVTNSKPLIKSPIPIFPGYSNYLLDTHFFVKRELKFFASQYKPKDNDNKTNNSDLSDEVD